MAASVDLVSVVVPTHDMAHIIGDALDSVRDQTYGDWECIVVDDGSVDDTRGTVDRYMASDTRFKYLYQDPQGPSAARNAGIDASTGAFIAFLDADDVWLARKLEVQMETMRARPGTGLSCTYFEEVDGELRLLREWDQIREGYPDRVDAEALVATFGACRLPGSASAALVRRSCLDDVGLFDPTLRLGEDLDLWYRIALRFPIAVEPEVLLRLRKLPKEVDPGRVLGDLGRMVAKFESIAPADHRPLIAEAEFDLRWGIFAECVRRRRPLRALGGFSRLLLTRPRRTATAVRSAFRRGGNA